MLVEPYCVVSPKKDLSPPKSITSEKSLPPEEALSLAMQGQVDAALANAVGNEYEFLRLYFSQIIEYLRKVNDVANFYKFSKEMIEILNALLDRRIQIDDIINMFDNMMRSGINLGDKERLLPDKNIIIRDEYGSLVYGYYSDEVWVKMGSFEERFQEYLVKIKEILFPSTLSN